MIEPLKDGSSKKIALGFHLGSLVRNLSDSNTIHLRISLPTKDEVMIQATGIAF
jgi:hypothetical protein